MANFTDVNGHPVSEQASIDDQGNIVQPGVISMDDLHKQYGGGSGARTEPIDQPPVAEDDDEPNPNKIELDTEHYDPELEVKVGEDTYKAADILTAAAEEAKKDGATLSDKEKAELVADYVKRMSEEESPTATNTEDTDDKEITIGGETKKSSEWFAQMEEEDDADYSELPEKTRQNLLNRFIAAKNDGAWKKSNTEVAQANAEHKRELEREAREIEQKRRSLEFNKKRIEAKVTKLKELAEKQFDENEIYDAEGKLIPKKQFEYNQILNAQQQLPELEEELKQLSEESAQAESDQLLAQINSLQANHPELRTKENFVSVIRKVEKERQLDHPDFPTVRMIRRVLSEAAESNVDPETAYGFLVADGLIKPARATQPTKSQSITQPQNPVKRLANAIVRKQTGATPSLPAGASRPKPTTKNKIRLGAQIAQELRGNNGNGKALAEWNF